MRKPIRPAATVLILRDGPAKPALEVFMVRRAQEIDTFSNTLVFPGGKVDAADRNAVMREVSVGATDLGDEEVAFRACAIRETFEETGVLLAYAEDGAMVGVDDKLAHAQKHLNAGDFGFIDVVDNLGVKLAMDALAPFSRWVAPEMAPKRFDTMFYLVRQPGDQMPVHDGYESVDSDWVRPGDLIDQWERGEAQVIFPTRLNLMKLGMAETVSGAMMRTRAETFRKIEPMVEKREDGPWLTIPSDAGYPVWEEHLQRVLRGEDIEARSIDATAADVSGWRDVFLSTGASGLKHRPRDVRDEEIDRLRTRVGEVTMDNELLVEKIAKMEAGHPGRRRSKR